MTAWVVVVGVALAMGYHAGWVNPLWLGILAATGLAGGIYLRAAERAVFRCAVGVAAGVDLVLAAWLSGAGLAVVPLGVAGVAVAGLSVAALVRTRVR